MSLTASFLTLLAFIYFLGFIISPFPYWKTYRILWKAVLTAPGKPGEKLKQALFLIRSGAGAPFWALLWYLDEICFSEYKKMPVEPVFIIGQPRCGTTLLHRTLASDTANFFAVRHIEWRYPFICIQKPIELLGIKNKLCSISYWSSTDAGKLAAKMHPNTLADWEEEGIFFEEVFLHHFFLFLRFPYPGLLEKVDAFPELPVSIQKRMVDVHQKVVQKVSYLRGATGRLYLSKEVTSHNKIPTLVKRYPQARFIIIVRNSRCFLSSLLALVRMSTKSKTGRDPTDIPGWEEELIDRMRRDSLLLVNLCAEVIPDNRQTRIPASSFAQDITEGVRFIYKGLNLAISDEFAARLRLMDKKQTTRKRGYEYPAIEMAGFEEYDGFVQEVVAGFESNRLRVTSDQD